MPGLAHARGGHPLPPQYRGLLFSRAPTCELATKRMGSLLGALLLPPLPPPPPPPLALTCTPHKTYCRGCVQSVNDKEAAGTWSAGANNAQREADAQAAVAELLGGATMSSPVEIAVKCRRIPNKDTFRCEAGAPVFTLGKARAGRHSAVPFVLQQSLVALALACIHSAPHPHTTTATPYDRSKSDPMAVLLVGDPRGTSWSEVARTDVVANSLGEAQGRLGFERELRRVPCPLPSLQSPYPVYPSSDLPCHTPQSFPLCRSCVQQAPACHLHV